MAQFVAQLPEDGRDDTDTMLLVFTLCGRQTVSASVVASILQKTPEEAEVVLRRVATDPPGILEATPGTLRRSHPSYRLRGSALELLGPAVRYQRRSVDEIDRKVIQHVREYSRITNKTMRNMLDVDVQRAKQILVDLVARQILVKTWPQQRGPNIEYGPGPQFPPRSPRSRRSVSENVAPSGERPDARSRQLHLNLPVGPPRRRPR
jgi:ATP-dependent DNA helicase RecG